MLTDAAFVYFGIFWHILARFPVCLRDVLVHTNLRLFVVSCDKLCYSEHFSCTYSLRGKWKKLQLGGAKDKWALV